MSRRIKVTAIVVVVVVAAVVVRQVLLSMENYQGDVLLKEPPQDLQTAEALFDLYSRFQIEFRRPPQDRDEFVAFIEAEAPGAKSYDLRDYQINWGTVVSSESRPEAIAILTKESYVMTIYSNGTIVRGAR